MLCRKASFQAQKKMERVMVRLMGCAIESHHTSPSLLQTWGHIMENRAGNVLPK